MKTKKELEKERQEVWKQIETLESKVESINREINNIPVDPSLFIGKAYCQENEEEQYKLYFYVKDFKSNFRGLIYTTYITEDGIERLDTVAEDYKKVEFFTREDVKEVSKKEFDLLTVKVCNQILTKADLSNIIWIS